MVLYNLFAEVIKNVVFFSGGSSNGRTLPFEGRYLGPTPSPPAKKRTVGSERAKRSEISLSPSNKKRVPRWHPECTNLTVSPT